MTTASGAGAAIGNSTTTVTRATVAAVPTRLHWWRWVASFSAGNMGARNCHGGSGLQRVKYFTWTMALYHWLFVHTDHFGRHGGTHAHGRANS